MMHLDANVLMAMLQDKEREIGQLKAELAAERQIAVRWEHEAKALRREVVSLRMDTGNDTETFRIAP